MDDGTFQARFKSRPSARLSESIRRPSGAPAGDSVVYVRDAAAEQKPIKERRGAE